MTATRRTILHGDLDAFYASVEVLDNPELRGRPVIVGGEADGRGVVSAASYEARRFGIHSAMPLRTAARLCPQGVFLPGRFDRYRELSGAVMTLFAGYTPLVEPISLDEAFLDVTASTRAFGDGPTIARSLKQRVHTETGLVLSVGVASNKLVAKVASDLDKPDGLVVVPEGEEAAFLAPLPVGRLWGIGPTAAERLKTRGVTTIGQLAALSTATVRRLFGNHGEELRLRARGVDPSSVRPFVAAKTIGHEVTFGRDLTADADLEAALLELADAVSRRLRAHSVSAAGVQLKLRYEGFETITRQTTLGRQVSDAEALFAAGRALLTRARDPRRAVRLLGLTAIALSPTQQLTLFDRPAERSALDTTVDDLRRRFGRDAVVRGRLVGKQSLRRPSERPVSDVDN